MTISVTEFKARCLEILRDLEASGGVVEIERRGRIVARVFPATGDTAHDTAPWMRLRGSGELHAEPDESVLSDEDFEAGR